MGEWSRCLDYNYDLAFDVNGTTSWHTKVDRADKHIRELEEVIKEYFSAANPSILLGLRRCGGTIGRARLPSAVRSSG